MVARIEDDAARQATFQRRKRDLIRQAMELAILCDCDVQVFVHGARVDAAKPPCGPSTYFASGDPALLLKHATETQPAERYGQEDYPAFAKASLKVCAREKNEIRDGSCKNQTNEAESNPPLYMFPFSQKCLTLLRAFAFFPTA